MASCLICPLKVSADDELVLNNCIASHVVKDLAEQYEVTILLAPDLRDRRITGHLKGQGLDKILDSLSWLLHCQWRKEGDIYYIGGSDENFLVLPSCGFSKELEKSFNDKIKVVADKIIVSGSEKEITKISKALKQLSNRDFCSLDITAVEFVYDKNISLGIEIDKALSYSFSWEGIVQHSYNPIQNLVMSVKASIHTDATYVNTDTILKTRLGVLAGELVELSSGQDIDRPVYSEADDSGSRVIQSYNTQSTGLIMQLKGFKQADSWILRYSIENSRSKSDKEKTLTKITSSIRISDNKYHLLGSLDKKESTASYKKGIPYLCDIPWLGYIFRVTETVKVKRRIYFFCRVKKI